jgi:hypothetical protein
MSAFDPKRTSDPRRAVRTSLQPIKRGINRLPPVSSCRAYENFALMHPSQTAVVIGLRGSTHEAQDIHYFVGRRNGMAAHRSRAAASQ